MRTPFRDLNRRRGAFRLFARLLASALLVLLSAGYALPGLHFAAVAHEICAEHGELHHAETGEAHERLGGEASKTPAVFGASRAVEHAHDHCSVWSSSAPGTAVLREAALALVVLEPGKVALAVCDCEAKHTLDVLSYAPKLAPPV